MEIFIYLCELKAPSSSSFIPVPMVSLSQWTPWEHTHISAWIRFPEFALTTAHMFASHLPLSPQLLSICMWVLPCLSRLCEE